MWPFRRSGSDIEKIVRRELRAMGYRDQPRTNDPDRFRNWLAALLIAGFLSCLPLLTWKVIPSENKEIITYIIGQISGLATMAAGFYFAAKVGEAREKAQQAELDAARADNTGKLADLAAAALNTPSPPAPSEDAAKAASQVADAAVDEARHIKEQNT